MATRRQRVRRRRITMLVCGFLLIVLLIVSLFLPFNIKINGPKTVTVDVFDEYEDQGAQTRFVGSVKTSNPVNTNKVGTYKVKYKWLLETATRKVKVVDTEDPTITLEGKEEMNVMIGSEFNDPGWTTTDNYDDNVKVTVDQKVDTSKERDYTLTYTAKDSSGNTATATRVVHVMEDNFEYANSITNTAGVNDAVISTLEGFYNNYYRSLKYLEEYDGSSYFSNTQNANIYNTAIKYLVNYRKNAPNDLTCSDVYYDLYIDSAVDNGSSIVLKVYENSNLCFNFLKGTTSKLYHIENTFTLIPDGSGYKIQSLDKIEKYYMIFYQDVSGRTLDEIYNVYMDLSTTQQSQEAKYLDAVNDGSASITTTAANEYDRDAAVEYAQKYWSDRNPEYNAFESNCMNFGSQVIHAGGVPMDCTGDAGTYQQWKNCGNDIDTSNTLSGFLETWTYIPYFRSYIQNNVDGGLVAELNDNIYLAEGGDMIQVSAVGNTSDSYTHNMVVVKVVQDDQGNVEDILCNGNTLNMQNYPISAYVYPYKTLVKVVGWN